MDPLGMGCRRLYLLNGSAKQSLQCCIVFLGGSAVASSAIRKELGEVAECSGEDGSAVVHIRSRNIALDDRRRLGTSGVCSRCSVLGSVRYRIVTVVQSSLAGETCCKLLQVLVDFKDFSAVLSALLACRLHT